MKSQPYYSKSHKDIIFKVGDFVMLRPENTTSTRQCKKFDERYIYRPSWGKNAYKLRLVPYGLGFKGCSKRSLESGERGA
jgi:hypothetical protein